MGGHFEISNGICDSSEIAATRKSSSVGSLSGEIYAAPSVNMMYQRFVGMVEKKERNKGKKQDPEQAEEFSKSCICGGIYTDIFYGGKR
jgi:hypothetical protein